MNQAVGKQSIVFDLDDTLIPSSQFYLIAAKEVLGSDSDWDLFFGQARSQVKANLPAGHVAARNRLLYFKAYLELRNDRRRSALQLYNSYEQALSRLIRNWSIQVGRTELLRNLSTHFSLYILTNENTRTQLAKLDAMYIDPPDRQLFHGVLTSEEAGVEKPNRSIFELLLKTYDLNPRHCIFVGDSLETDIMPSCDIGMRAILLTEFQENQSVPLGCEAISRLDMLWNIL